MPRIVMVGIAGGSGVGKSTLGEELLTREPDIFQLIQLDDYFRKPFPVFSVESKENRDHPNALDFDGFVRDLTELKTGRSVVLMTKNRKYNPGYDETNEKVRVELRPKPIILVEGFLILHDERVRALLDKSIWLDAPGETRWDRREGRNELVKKDTEYQRKILEPMHQEFVEPTRRYADKVLDTDLLTAKEVRREIERWFHPYFISGELKNLG